MAKLKTVFMGSDSISLPLLDSIADEHSEQLELAGVFTQPDRPHGRGMKLRETPIKAWAKARGLIVHQPETLDETHVELLRELKVDLLLVMAYGHLLSQELLNSSRLPPLNFHASLLPKLRGASPIETAIATGADRTGVSLMRIVRKMDAGPVLDQQVVSVQPDDTKEGVYEKLAQACIPLFRRNLQRIISGQLDFKEQIPEEVTYCRIISKDDGAMDFTASAQVLYHRNRAFQPWPGQFFELNGQRIKVGEARVCNEPATGAEPGQVLTHATAEGLAVATGNGTLLLRTLQRPGGKMLPAADFVRGFPIEAGTLLASSKTRPLVAKNRREFLLDL